MRLAILMLLFVGTAAQAKVELWENYRYYPVNASTKQELITATAAHTPIKKDGLSDVADSSYAIQWRFYVKEWNRQCRIDTYVTDLRIEVTLPKLQVSTTEVQDLWARWYPNLLRHEMQHVAIAKKAANDIDDALRSLGSKANCKVLEQEANAVANAILAKAKEAQLSYDKETRYGETEGASLQSL